MEIVEDFYNTELKTRYHDTTDKKPKVALNKYSGNHNRHFNTY